MKRTRLALYGVVLLAALTWGGLAAGAGAPDLDMQTEWRHVPREPQAAGSGGGAARPGGGRADTDWDLWAGVGTLGALGVVLQVPAVRRPVASTAGGASAIGRVVAPAPPGGFWGGLLRGIARSLPVFVLAAAVTQLVIAFPILAIPALIGGGALLGWALVSSYQARAAEVEQVGQPRPHPFWLGLTAAGDVLGVTSLWEGATGRRIFTGRVLTTEERGEVIGNGTVQVATFLYPSVRGLRVRGQGAREAAVTGEALQRAKAGSLPTKETAAQAPNTRLTGLSARQATQAKAMVKVQADSSGSAVGSSPEPATFQELRHLVKHLRDSDVPRQHRRQVIEAFGPGARVEQLRSDLYVYRYYGGTASPRGRWLTEQVLTDPVQELALPPNSTAEYVKRWIVPRGTVVVRGTVAPNFGRPGGASQVYVVNSQVLVEVSP